MPLRPVVPLLCLLLAMTAPASASAALPVATGDGTPLPTLAPMLEGVQPTVVNVATYATVRRYASPLLNDPFFRRFFQVPESQLRGRTERRTVSAGSGVIVDARSGYVLTNAHVVEGANEIEIGLLDGRTLPAKLVGADRHVDIAVLQVRADALAQIRVGRPEQPVRVGDFVVAIGNPFGLGQTVTSGIVSALGRSGLGIEGLEDFIQTDASINPGNSGGALVNLRGELIGINTAIIAPGGGNIGIGFAIPADLALRVMRDLVTHGEVRRGVIGLATQDLTPELAAAFGLTPQARGVLLTAVEPDGPAARAGLRAGDVLVGLDGRPLRRSDELRNRVGLARAGDSLSVDYLREGTRRSARVTLVSPRRGE